MALSELDNLIEIYYHCVEDTLKNINENINDSEIMLVFAKNIISQEKTMLCCLLANNFEGFNTSFNNFKEICIETMYYVAENFDNDYYIGLCKELKIMYNRCEKLKRWRVFKQFE